MGRRETGTDSCFHYTLCFHSAEPFSGLRTRMRYANPLGSQFVQFFYLFLRETRRLRRHSGANLFSRLQISRKGNASTAKGDPTMTEDKQGKKKSLKDIEQRLWWFRYEIFLILSSTKKNQFLKTDLLVFEMQVFALLITITHHSRFKCRYIPCAGLLLLNHQWIRLIPRCNYPSPLSMVASRDSSGQKSSSP